MASLQSVRRKFVWTFLMIAAAACGGSSGGGGTPTSPSPTPSGPSATITITNDAISPGVVDISAGQRVEFVNAGTRMFQIFTTPHNVHSDCPPINEVSELQPGQRKMTGALTTTRICGFHDHQNPTSNAHRGSIRVGTSSGPTPEY